MVRPQKVAVLGASGFIGSHVLAYAGGVGADVEPVTMPRVAPIGDPQATVAEAAAGWRRTHQGAFDDLCLALASCDVVINAAGHPRSGSRDSARLGAANTVLPAVLARAAHAAGVGRLVHISTAAVQGRRDPLDESAVLDPLSPYASSKAEAERYLRAARPERGEVPPELVVYRPASVHAIGHPATRALARLVARLPFVPIEGNTERGKGARPVPVALVQNVAAGIWWAASMIDPAAGNGRIVLQPDEGMTARRLVELFGARRILALPPRATNATLTQLGRLTRPSPYLTSRLRWFELLLRGQAIDARVLPDAGFTPPVGFEGWEALAAAERTGR